jgi:hypothetical protein
MSHKKAALVIVFQVEKNSTKKYESLFIFLSMNDILLFFHLLAIK